MCVSEIGIVAQRFGTAVANSSTHSWPLSVFFLAARLLSLRAGLSILLLGKMGKGYSGRLRRTSHILDRLGT